MGKSLFWKKKMVNNPNIVEFDNVPELALKYPNKICILSDEELDKIEVNNFVKISPGNEMIWVKVATISGEVLTGRIIHNTFFPRVHKLYYESIVTFTKKNVYAISLTFGG